MKKLLVCSALIIVFLAFLTDVWADELNVNQKAKLECTARVNAAAISSDGLYLAVAEDDGTVEVWDLQREARLGKARTNSSAPVQAVVFASDYKKFVAGYKDGSVVVWDTVKMAPLYTIKTNCRSVSALAVNLNERRLAVAGDTVIELYDFAQGTFLGRLNGHKDPIVALQFSTDGQLLHSVGKDKVLNLWDVNSQELIRSLKEMVPRLKAKRLEGVAVSGDGKKIALAFNELTLTHEGMVAERIIKLLDSETGREIKSIKTGFEDQIYALALNPLGTLLVAVSCDKPVMVKMWNTQTDVMVFSLRDWGQPSWCSFSPTGFQMTVAEKNTVGVWNVGDAPVAPPSAEKAIIKLKEGARIAFVGMENKNKSLPPDVVETLNSLVTNELSKYSFGNSRFTLLTRDKLDKILKEIKHQMIFGKPDEMVKVGQMAGAEKIIAGAVSKTESMIVIDLQMLDVESGKIVASEVEKSQTGDIYIITAGENIVRKLMMPVKFEK